MKILLLHGTAEALELFDDVGLRAMNAVRAGGVRTDGHKLLDVLVGARAVKAACGIGRRRGRKRSPPAGMRLRSPADEEDCPHATTTERRKQNHADSRVTRNHSMLIYRAPSRAIGGLLGLVPDHHRRHADAHKIQSDHGRHEDKHRHGVGRGSHDRGNHRDDQDRIAQILPEKFGVTILNSARKKINTGNSKIDPTPNRTIRMKSKYSLMRDQRPERTLKSDQEIQHVRKHDVVAKRNSGQKKEKRRENKSRYGLPLMLVKSRRDKQATPGTAQ